MIKTTPRIQFHFLASCSLPNRRSLKVFIISIFKREKRALSNLRIIFCTDAYLLNLNRKFLQHDYYTDILSFPLSAPEDPLSAEIYISIDRIRENAKMEKVGFQQELHRVIFHGILHFCGYEDKSAKDIKRMRSQEDSYLRRYFKSLQAKT
jgi:probable rRNA maturation factor